MTFWPPLKRSNDWNWPPMTSNLQNKGTIEISDLKNLLEDTSHDTHVSYFIWPPFWPPILRLYNQNWPPMTSYFQIDLRFKFSDPKNHRKDTQHDLFAIKITSWHFDLHSRGQTTEIDLQWPRIFKIKAQLKSAT